MGDSEWEVVIGEIVAPFGMHGEVKVLPHTDFPNRFERLEQVYVGKDEAPGRIMRLESARQQRGIVVVKFTDCDTRSSAEELLGAKLRIRKRDLVPLGTDEYYIHDIIGLDVITTEGKSLGRVKEVIRSPANDVYVTDRAMIPAVKEFVVKIDLEGRQMVVRPISGMVQE